MADDKARSITALGRWVVVLLGLAVFMDLAAVVVGLAERELFGRIASGSFTDAEVNDSDNRMAMIRIAQLSIYLVTGIVFIVWFHRAYKNLVAFGAELPHKRGWAIGAWFVPILNLFRPKGMADAIWQASDPELPHPAGDEWSKREAPLFMHVWWVTWILSLFLGRAYANMGRTIESIDQAQTLNTVGLASDGLGAVAGILAIAFVKGATKRQELRMQKPVAPTPPPELTGTVSPVARE